MSPRAYRLGRRRAAVERTHEAILEAARELVAAGAEPSVGEIARRAGVSRVTVYNRLGGRASLFAALARAAATAGADDRPDLDPHVALRRHFAAACTAWAADPRLFRHLPRSAADSGRAGEAARRLATRLAEVDLLRPGCSVREAEDVIAALGTFAVFDRLHGDGRRPPAAVTDVLMRLASAVLT